jgi:hypothetical protein
MLLQVGNLLRDLSVLRWKMANHPVRVHIGALYFQALSNGRHVAARNRLSAGRRPAITLRCLDRHLTNSAGLADSTW